MRLAVLGAGAVGPGAAALAVSRGHEAAIWSPRGGGTHGIGSSLSVQGVLSGTARVSVAVDVARALDRASAVLVSVPPHALGPLLRRIAPMLPDGVPVLLAPSHSLAPLLLDRLLARRGLRVPVAALAVPPVVAERLAGDEVRILALPEAVEIATVPAASAEAMARLCSDLFGMAFVHLSDALGAALAAHEPVLQSALILGNVTRIEAGEAWDQHRQMTPAICRLAERLDAERLALAEAYGHAVPSLPAGLHRMAGVPVGPLPVMARALAALRPAPGLRGLDATQLAQSVTYGLALWLRLAAARGVPMPLTGAAMAVLEAMWGASLSADDLLEGLDFSRLRQLLRDGHPRD
ncbi:NAD/NADP octopine/nopaline dehydrogenase family protein [Falsiroseomonas sp. HC035]|uniref:NAD/NADP octopine/nopaline dehydrogenase family protein n=1 Tax=Falsiroseomonas sp. HC035 TaxID=3390999 RepID=UPI003D3112C2